ncbi:PLP-dependent transferase, partial [Klebsiella pneumoniae]|uniref:PLP-dependent transferase n=1 Tax=Klebsiella pneumoniae TaxID=573 RepID=UPI001C7293AB
RDFASLSPSVQRASTVVFDSLDAFVNRKHRQPDGFSYGVTGTPTARLLEDRIAALEGGRHCVITPSGAAALEWRTPSPRRRYVSPRRSQAPARGACPTAR